MNRTVINSHSIDITPSVYDEGNMEMLSEEEFHDVCQETTKNAPKRARYSTMQEITNDNGIGTRAISPFTEITNLDNIVYEFKEKIQRMHCTNKQLFDRTMRQLQQNYVLMEKQDITDIVSILEEGIQDDYEIDLMETEITKNDTKPSSQYLVSGQKIMIGKKDPVHEKKFDNKLILTKALDVSTNFCLLNSDTIDEYSIKQLRESEYCWLMHVVQSEEIRNNPAWNHSVDLFPNNNSNNKDMALVETSQFNRNCKEALITIETYNQSPDEFTIQAWYLVRKDMMCRLRLYDKIRRNLPWFQRNINIMQICGMNKNAIMVNKLGFETKYCEEYHYKWLRVSKLQACLIVFGVALEKGFCPLHPQVDFCTVSYTINDTIISCKAGFCLGGRVRYNGLVGHVNCIVDGCSNVAKQFNGKCYMHFFGTCSVEGCPNVANYLNGQCRKHFQGQCSVDGCLNVARINGKCNRHYKKQCIVDGCSNIARTKGKCEKHRFGICTIDDCSNYAIDSKGRCKKHAE